MSNINFDHAISTALEKFNNIRALKKEQLLIVTKLSEGRDVFAELPTGFGKSLTYQIFPGLCEALRLQGDPRWPEHPMIFVVCPLKSIMEDQVETLLNQEIAAAVIGQSEATDKEILMGTTKYRVIFGSPEVFLGNERFRAAFQLEVYRTNIVALICDEVHTVVQWGEGRSKNTNPFRKWCGLVGELRSLLPEQVPVLALTATATPSTRQKIMRSLSMKKCFEVLVSPNRRNIRLHVEKISTDPGVGDIFSWIPDRISNNNINAQRVVVYTQSIACCSDIYQFVVRTLKEKAYWPHGARRISTNRLVAMYHSGTDPDIQKFVLDSLGKPDGIVRVVIATSALGMGVDMKNLNLVVNYGPPGDIESYMQQVGRAGRDGKQSDGIILYFGRQLRMCDPDMLAYIKAEGCRRSVLLGNFEDDTTTEKLPGHLCCDNCGSDCSCGNETCCFEKPVVIKEISEDTSTDDMPRETRDVSNEQKQKLLKSLKECQHRCRNDTLLFSHYSFFSNLDLISYFPDSLIDEILDHSAYIFSLEDLLQVPSIWSVEHAKAILQCINIVFNGNGDMELIGTHSLSRSA